MRERHMVTYGVELPGDALSVLSPFIPLVVAASCLLLGPLVILL